MGRAVSLFAVLVLGACGEEPAWVGTYAASGTWKLDGPFSGGRTVGDAAADLLVDAASGADRLARGPASTARHRHLHPPVTARGRAPKTSTRTTLAHLPARCASGRRPTGAGASPRGGGSRN